MVVHHGLDRTCWEADAVQGVNTTGTSRFEMLQAGDIDVLIRNTTRTLSRDSALNLNFAPTTFYDGQGFLVRMNSGIVELSDLAEKTICVQAETTWEEKLHQLNESLNPDAVIWAYNDNQATIENYLNGACDALTADVSGLAAIRTVNAMNPNDHQILAELISKEPLGPVVRHGDDDWFDVVTWTVNCTIAADEYGITSANVDQMLLYGDSEVQRILADGDLGSLLGLNADYCYEVIKQVGNYREIYERNLSPLGLDAVTLNRSYQEGGLLYAPPFR